MVPQFPAGFHGRWSSPKLCGELGWPPGGAVWSQQLHPKVQLATGDQAPGALRVGYKKGQHPPLRSQNREEEDEVAWEECDPSYFDDNWINRIKTEVGDNWRLKVLGQQINDFTLPDVNLIGEHSDASELGRMLQLILGCAVNCEQKQEYIKTIMMMEESVQHVVMTAIQELMSKETPVGCGNDSYVDLDRQLKKTTEELNEALAAKDEIAQRCHELDMQAYLVQEERDRLRLECNELDERVAALQEEKGSLLAENQILMERLNQSDSIEDPNSPAGRRHLQLQTQLEQLQEETFRLEAAKDDYRIRCEELEKEIVELRGQNEELTSLADEAQSLKDEMDVLRHSSDKVAKLEGMVESYKKKLEDLGDLRRQVKLLEEKNTLYMQNTVSLEEELRKANATRGQLETYKRQRLRTERESLKETIEELRCVQAQEGQLTAGQPRTASGLLPKSSGALLGRFGNQGSPPRQHSLVVPQTGLRFQTPIPMPHCRCPNRVRHSGTLLPVVWGNHLLLVSPLAQSFHHGIQARERLIRLQHENKMLKLNQEGSDNEKIALLQSLLEDANSRKNELETENRIVNQRLLEVQSQVDELQKSLQEQGSKAEDRCPFIHINMCHFFRIMENREKMREMTNELQKKRSCIEDLETKYNNSCQKLEELEDALGKKDEEMKLMEERYKKYLEKAKSVIRTLDPKQNQGSAPEVQALKNQLQERERMIHCLEKEYEKTKTQREQEEKLIVSAWYNMGMTLQKKAAEDRLASTGSGQSFLARQRQANSTRRPYPGHVQPATAR
ncbi:HOOK3 protein, partial [Polypterus senegalus]